jgi:hypothetical protein
MSRACRSAFSAICRLRLGGMSGLPALASFSRRSASSQVFSRNGRSGLGSETAAASPLTQQNITAASNTDRMEPIRLAPDVFEVRTSNLRPRLSSKPDTLSKTNTWPPPTITSSQRLLSRQLLICERPPPNLIFRPFGKAPPNLAAEPWHSNGRMYRDGTSSAANRIGERPFRLEQSRNVSQVP